jgi:prepilin-type N-terminal cleavage/methylation domain-containing protein
MKRQKGFSLIELLLVVAVILVLTGIAIPSLIRSRIAGNEASAVQTLKQMGAASIAYQIQCDDLGFEASLTLLGNGSGDCTSGANLLDNVLGGSASPQKSGYVFTFTGDGQTPSVAYTIQADPVSSLSGSRHFFIDQSGTVRENDTAQATVSDAALQ